MPRTNDAAVKDILGANYDGKASMARHVAAANLLTTRVATCASDKGQPMSAAELKELETWLAGWYYMLRDPAFTSRSTMSASGSWQRTAGQGLEYNEYGRGALGLDFSGCLREIFSNQVAGGFWAGTEENAQTDYEDRN